jgi:hypothetical protein
MSMNMTLDEQIKSNEMYIQSRLGAPSIQKRSLQQTTANYLSGTDHIMANLASGPLFEPDRNKSQVAVKDYISNLSKDIAGPVLMNIQSISRIMSPTVKPINKTQLSKTVQQKDNM